MSRIFCLCVTMMILLIAASAARAQQIHLPPAAAQGASMDNVPVTSGDKVQQEQARAANLQRQVEIRRDAEKMLELTQELKDYLQKNDQTVMSMDALKKAEQIEKLAHSVRSKMKQLY